MARSFSRGYAHEQEVLAAGERTTAGGVLEGSTPGWQRPVETDPPYGGGDD